jgi:hypothetical protein
VCRHASADRTYFAVLLKTVSTGIRVDSAGWSLTLQPQIVVGGAFVLVGACSGLARSSPVRPVCDVLCDSGQGPEDPVE